MNGQGHVNGQGHGARSSRRTRARATPRQRLGGRLVARLPLPGWKLALLAAFVALAFAIGGGSRADLASLALLRPVAALTLGWGIIHLETGDLRRYRPLVAILVACVVLLAAQLVPLPPRVYAALPGRALIGTIAQAVDQQAAWRPMSLAPELTSNALQAMLVPAAVLMLAIQLATGEMRQLLGGILLIGLASAILAVAQLAGDPHGPLYWYGDTNFGSAVGLFANRNHQAVFLATLLPMLACWATPPGRLSGEQAPTDAARAALWRFGAALTAGAGIVVLVLVTGSRAGMLSLAVALACVPVVSRAGGGTAAHAVARRRLVWIAGGLTCVLVAATLALGRAEAINRILATRPADDLRIRALPTLYTMTAEYWPWGSGLGSFKPTFRMHEPDALIDPTILNHAHNDLIEAVLTGGLPAVLIILGAAYIWLKHLADLPMFRRGAPGDGQLRAAGLAVILVLAAASVSDYPLRVPSLSCLLVCAAIWATQGGTRSGAGHIDP